MEFYNGMPISGTKQHRVVLKFREAKEKPKARNRKIRLDKRMWLDYTGPTSQQQNK